MGLYERVLGLELPKISEHWVLALLAEFGRGQITKAQIDAALNLSPAEQAELQTLASTFTGAVSAKLLRALEVQDVLMLGKSKIAPYTTVAAVKTRLGV